MGSLGVGRVLAWYDGLWLTKTDHQDENHDSRYFHARPEFYDE